MIPFLSSLFSWKWIFQTGKEIPHPVNPQPISLKAQERKNHGDVGLKNEDYGTEKKQVQINGMVIL